MGGEKATTIHTTSSTVLPSTPPRLTRRQPPRPDFLGLGLIRSSSTPQLCPDPASTAIDQQRNDARTSATGIARSTQGPGSFTVPLTTPPRHPGDGRPFPEHAATATSTAPIEPSPLRHHLRVLGAPESSLDPIKGRGDRGKKRDTFLHF
jgi:hypothetical protein